MRGKVPFRLAAIVAFTAVAFPAAAASPGPGRLEITCDLYEAGTVLVDGLLDEWPRRGGARRAGVDPRDAAVTIRCGYDRERLYLVVDVADERLLRSRRPGPGDDRLVMTFAGERLTIHPGHGGRGTRLAVAWANRRRPTKPLEVVDSLQRHGWSIELALPLAKVPGWSAGAPAIPFRLELHDADLATERRAQEVLATGDGRLVFQESAALLKQFLDQFRLRRSDVRVDALANMDGDPAVERVVVGGRILGVLDETYTYLELPVRTPRDLLEVRVVDLAGAGKASVLVRYLERGGGGSREVLSVWNVVGSRWTRTFAHEIAKQLGPARITSVWSLVPRKKGRGVDLVIKRGTAVGANARTWREVPAEDMAPILLPWSGKKREVWRFVGDAVSGG